MVTFHELADLLRSLGLDPGDLALWLAKKAGAKGRDKLVGASKAVFSNFLRRLRDWREHNQLEIDIENEANPSDREAVMRAYLERWIAAQQREAAETTKLLFRIVYLRALRAHCDDFPVVANLGFAPRALNDIWIEQHFRPSSVAERAGATKGDGQRSASFSLERALSERGPRIVVEGAAGSGKSTQLRKFVLSRVAELLTLDDSDQFLREPIPIFLNAADLAETESDLATSLETAVRSSLGLRLPGPMPSGFFDRRQPGAANRILLVVDGINEIDASRRDHLVSAFGHAAGDPLGDVSVIISSWPLDSAGSGAWRGFYRIEVCDFDAAQASSLAIKLLGQTASKKFLDQHSRLPRSPMLLTLAALLQSEAAISSRAVLYREFILALLKRRSDAGLLPGSPAKQLQFLSVFAHDEEILDIDSLADLAEKLDLIGSDVLGLARLRGVESLLIATGIVVHRSGRLEFIHYSFRSYLRAQNLAKVVAPNARNVWSLVSPFREDWDTVVFVCEIWMQEGKDVAVALEALLAFGEPGLRVISSLASRFVYLPPKIVQAAVARWMYQGDEFWVAGYVDGPVQQVTLIAFNYEDGRDALRRIAGNSEDYWEDAIYAARGLVEVGLSAEARDFLMAQVQDVEGYCVHRVRAAETLFGLGFVGEAVGCLEMLASEWLETPPDTALAEIDLGKALFQAGRKRAGLSYLKRLSQVVDDLLDKEWLATAYMELGYLRQAAKLAREVYRNMEWSRELARGHSSTASSLLDLLEQAGLKKEANVVRKSISDTKEVSQEKPLRSTLNSRERPDRRLASANDLLRQSADKLALEALKGLAGDPRAPRYERFSAIDSMLGAAGGRERAIELLKRIAEDEPSCRVACGRSLVLAGELKLGWSTLCRIALEPAESEELRIEAICELAKLGRLDIATAGFRRLCNAGIIHAVSLSSLAEAFAHTASWSEFLGACEQLSRTGRTAAVQVLAIEIVRRSGRAIGEVKHPRLLRKIVLNRELLVKDRINAAYELLEDPDGFGSDLLFDITTSSDETMEAGLGAMDALYVKGYRFEAADGGSDVVWDKKLSQDQFIEAAHHFLRKFDGDDLDKWEAGIAAAVAEELVDIASDAAQPFERRLAAAAIDLNEKNFAVARPFWKGVYAIIDDEGTPIGLRYFAMLYAVRHDPALIARFGLVLADGRMPALHLAEVYRAAKCFDIAVERYCEAMRASQDSKAKWRILSRLSDLSGSTAGDGIVERALTECFQSWHDLKVDSGTIKESLSVVGQGLPKKDRLDLALDLAKAEEVDSYEIGPALEVIADLAGEFEVQRIINERLARGDANVRRDFFSFYRSLYLQEMRATFGEADEAVRALSAMAQRGELGLDKRLLACRGLMRVGRGKDARGCLCKISAASVSAEGLLSIAETAASLHDWGVARSRFRAVALNKSADASSRIRAAGGLGRAGLPELGRDVLTELNLDGEGVVSLSIDALFDCGAEDAALALCRSHSLRSEVDLLDRVEVAYQAARSGRKDIVRSILVELTGRPLRRPFERDLEGEQSRQRAQD